MSRHALIIVGTALLPLLTVASCMGFSAESGEMGGLSEPDPSEELADFGLEPELEAEDPLRSEAAMLPDPRKNAMFPDRPELVLHLRGTGPVTMESGGTVPVELSLENVSQDEQRYVQAGDGSFAGWREPSIFYTAVRLGDDGQWHDVPEKQWGRCGMYDHEWQDEVQVLAPGKRAEIAWTTDPSWRLDLQKAGRVKIYAHYLYSAGVGFSNEEGSRGISKDLGTMKGIPAFELVSAPLDVTVERPLELSVMPTTFEGRAKKLSQLVSMQIENVSDETHQVGAPTRDRFRVQLRRAVDGSDSAWLYASEGPTNATGEGRQDQLKVDHALDLFRDGVDFDLPVAYQTGSFEIQVGYRSGDRSIGSDWVRIER